MNWQDKRSMTPREIKAALVHFSISQAALARYLGRGERTVHRWIEGDYQMSPAETLLIQGLIHHKEQPAIPPRPRR